MEGKSFDCGFITKFFEVGSMIEGAEKQRFPDFKNSVPNICEASVDGIWFHFEGKSSIFGKYINSSGKLISMTEYNT